MSSPKRRRLTPPPTQDDDGLETPSAATPRRVNQSTPRRTSLFSPTKASLNRSNLPQSQSAREARSRSRSRGNRESSAGDGGRQSPRANADNASQRQGRRDTMRMEDFAAAAADELGNETQPSTLQKRQSLEGQDQPSSQRTSRTFLDEESAEEDQPRRVPSGASQAPVAHMIPPRNVESSERTLGREQIDLPAPLPRSSDSRPPVGLAKSPARRPRKSKSLGEKLKSSPFNTLKSSQKIPERPIPESSRQTQLPDFPSGPNRPRKPEDPELVKKRAKRDDLVLQLNFLKERLRQTEEETRKYEAQPQAPLGKKASEKLINVLTTSHPSVVTTVNRTRPLDLSAFLPFAPRRPPKDTSDSATKLSSDDPVPSHRPVLLEDPLPYVSLFTPLRFTSQTSLSSSTAPLSATHQIRVTAPHSLLTASFTLVVEVVSSKATSVTLTSLSPWASPELQPWIDENAISQRDITAACTAIANYWGLAHQRAKLWWWCEGEFSELIAGGESAITRRLARRLGRPRKTPGGDAPDDEEPSRKELLAHLGQRCCVFERDQVRLRIEWRIELDWIGEARSRYSVNVGVASNWSKDDDRGSFKGVDAVFRKLVRENGVKAAIRGITSVLFP